MSGRDEFYVGWEPRAPVGLARFARVRALLLLGGALAIAAAVAAFHAPLAPARFEFGVVRTFEGRLAHIPYPTLVVERPGAPDRPSRWLLTVFGKRGADAITAPLDGRRVRLEGSLVHRDTRTMVELLPETLVDLGPAAAQPVADDAAGEQVVLVGEIVDSKCFLGVMNPGHLKPHRACAARCISGGVPPVLLVRDEGGRARYYLLVDEEGRAVNDRVLDRVAEPVRVRGRVTERDGLAILRADPASYERP